MASGGAFSGLGDAASTVASWLPSPLAALSSLIDDRRAAPLVAAPVAAPSAVGSSGGAGSSAPQTAPSPFASAPSTSAAPSSSSSSSTTLTTSSSPPSASSTMQTLAVELVSMAASYALLFFGLRYFMKEMDPLRKQKDQAKASQQRLATKLLANGRQPFSMSEYEAIISSDLIYPEDLDVGFSMIGGLSHVKTEIFDIVALPLRRPDLFSGRSRLLCPPKGILLFGPPGTGKTMMAKAIAKESGAAFINLQMSTTMNKWFGESQKLVRATFSLAWKLAPCVIFIDEIDSFLRERGSDDHAAQGNMKAEFMALWDGLLSSDIKHQGKGYGVIVVGATNRPWDVDQAILRRMPRTFKLDLPDADQRESILRLFLKDEHMQEELRRKIPDLAKMLANYSGSDLKELCQAAAMLPFRDFARACRTDGGLDSAGAEGQGEGHGDGHGDASQSQSQSQGQGAAPAEMRALGVRDFLTAMKDVKATGQAAYEYQDETQGSSTAKAATAASPQQQQQQQQQALAQQLLQGLQALQQQQKQQQRRAEVD